MWEIAKAISLMPRSFCFPPVEDSSAPYRPRLRTLCLSERSSVSNCRDECGRGDWADARYGKQAPAGFVLTRGSFHDAIRFPDEVGQLFQFVLQLRDQHAKRSRQPGRGIFENSGQGGLKMSAALPESDAALKKQTPDLVDHCGAPNDPALSHPVQRLHVELVIRLDRDKAHG